MALRRCPNPDIEIGSRHPVPIDCPGCRVATMNRFTLAQKDAAEPWGRFGRARSGLGRGGVGMRPVRVAPLFLYLALAVATAERPSPSETHTFGSLCDWRFTKR